MTRKDYMKEYYLMHKEGNRLKSIWRLMIRRCYDPKSISFKYYGQKGIAVCPEWRRDFTEFKKWSIDHGYSNELTLDRKDSNKDYSPDNCRWVTPRENTNNRKNTLFLTYQGITLPLTVWSDRLGINRHTLRDRVTRRGWSVEDAFTKPIQRHKKMNGERRGNTEKRF